MKDIILLYDDCCIYEIVILNYFLRYTNSQVEFCSVDQDWIQAAEGYIIRTDTHLKELDLTDVRSMIVPGGKIGSIDNADVKGILRALHSRGALVAGICAGVDVLDGAGLLAGIRSTHSSEEDCVQDGNVITARANAYVDFAIKAARALQLFADEKDLNETIDFWKYHKRLPS